VDRSDNADQAPPLVQIYHDPGDRLGDFLRIVAAVAIGVLIGGYFLFLLWSYLEGPMSTKLGGG
jgi:hypothetical protein